MKVEIWRDLKNIGYAGLYQISNTGRVRSVDRYVNHSKGNKALKKGKVIACKLDKDGYQEVSLWKNNKGTTFKVHRLVGSEFLDGDSTLEINHKDADRTNNGSENLEWCSRVDNIRHSSKLNWSIVTQMRRLSSENHLSNVAIAKRFNVSSTTVDKIINNVSWTVPA